MKLNLKRMALASLLATLGASTFAANYFFVAPKSMEMSKVAPFNVALGAYTLPGAVTGLAYNGGAGYDLNSLVSISGDPALNSALVSFAVTSGSLPAGLVLSAGGVLSGTPAVAGGGLVQVTASYKNAKGTQTYSVLSVNLTVVMAAATLPPGTVGTLYNNGAGFDFASELSAPADSAFNASLATFALTSGNMPAGMDLSSAGKLTGTPTTASVSTTLQIAATYKSNTGSQSYTWSSVAAGDPHWANVALLMHLDSLPLIDVKGRTISNNGVTLTSVAGTKGVTSGAFAGSGSKSFSVGGGVALGSTFTAELNFYPTGAPGAYNILIDNRNFVNSSTGIVLGYTGDYTLQVLYMGGQSDLALSAKLIPNAWNHLALVRSGSLLKLYLNGVSVGSNTAFTRTLSDTTLLVGRAQDLSYGSFGYMDELRVTPGIARYIANFTLSTTAYPDK